tara:strand:+ start:42378 stop:43436 length:1059 start_codon:yes stop_codon:yes gene_type:complete
VKLNHSQALFKWITLSILLTTFLGGCKAINQFLVKPMIKPTGDALTLLGEAHITPYLLTTDDLEAGCTGAEALGSMVMSIGRITEEPHELAVMLYLASGGCEEAKAFEQELAYLRYIRNQQPDMAQDALIAQKNHHVKAAKRYYKSWLELIAFNGGEEIGNGCPDLEQEFDQLVWLVGIVSGLQALNHDILSGVGTGVPKNIAAQAERAVGCLDNRKWFGVPLALKAAVWSLLPGALPEGENAWERLEQADIIGETANIRLAHVFHIISAYSKGDMERVRTVIKRHAEKIAESPANAQYKLLDVAATEAIQRVSDRMWTEAMGHRTPIGQLGTFWDENAADDIETVELDDLF